MLLLQTYLKNLKKKQKELSKKHPKDEAAEPVKSIATATDEEEDDSDLASIARELQNENEEDSDDIFNSPFIKKPHRPKVRHTSDNTTPLPEKEFSFIGSSKQVPIEEEQSLEPNTSKALDKFMRFDKKYSNFKALKKNETSEDDEEEESELLTSPAKTLVDLSPSPKSRLRRQAEQAGLKLNIVPKKISDASTTSEVSDHLTLAGTPTIPPHSPRSPRSPMFTLENLHDIEELLEDFPDASKSTEKGTTKENTPFDVQDNFFRFEVPTQQVLKKMENEVNDEDIIVTEDDVDEELIEIVLSEEQKSLSCQSSEANIKSPSLKPEEGPIVSPKRVVEVATSPKKPEKRVFRKKKKSKRVSTPEESTEMSTTEPSFSSSATDLKSKQKRKHKRDKKRRTQSQSCYYCKHICEYHQKSLKSETEKDKEKKPHGVNEAVQVGAPNAKYGKGHYMFDPTKDAMYQFPANNDNLAFIRTAWMNEVDERKFQDLWHQQGESSHRPMSYALSELMRGQLELTSNFLTTQKTLYANYCASLSKLIQEPLHMEHDKVLYPTLFKEAPKKGSESVPEEQEKEAHYESEFESESSEEEEENTIVPTEISVQSDSID